MQFRRSDNVIFEVVDGTALLVDADGRELLTLNRVGSLVWEALDTWRDASALADTLDRRFDDVDRPTLEADISTFLDELRAAGLVDDRP